MTSFFGGIFEKVGHGGSGQLRFHSNRVTPQSFFLALEELFLKLADPSLVFLNTIELDVEREKFPEVLRTFFSDEGWDYGDRWMIGEVCKDDRRPMYRHGRLTFESRPGLTGRLLSFGEGVRLGGPLLLGGVQVPESQVSSALRQSPFDEVGVKSLAAISASGWAATKNLDGLAFWVSPDRVGTLSALRKFNRAGSGGEAMKARAERLADDLQAVLDRSMSPEQFRTRNPIVESEPSVEKILCLVEHYLADADIRATDSSYQNMQEAEMRKLVSKLRSDRLDEAARVHFLGPSPD